MTKPLQNGHVQDHVPVPTVSSDNFNVSNIVPYRLPTRRGRSDGAKLDITDTSPGLVELVISQEDSSPQFQTLFRNEITIGREPGNDVVLVDDVVSRRHVRLERRGKSWFVTDLGSTNGTFFDMQRLTANVAYEWPQGQGLRLGSFMLHRRLAPEVRPDDTRIMKHDEHVTLQMELDKAMLAAGEGLCVALTIVNKRPCTVDYKLVVEGLPATWFELDTSQLTLHPNQPAHVEFDIHIPENDTVISGQHDFQVAVESLSDPNAFAIQVGSFEIEASHEFDFEINHLTQADQMICDVTVMNHGTAAQIFQISASSVDASVKFDAFQWHLALTPKTQDHLQIKMASTARPLTGAAKELPYRVCVSTAAGIDKVHEGSMLLQPRLTPQRLSILCVALIALSAIIWLAFNVSGSADDAQAAMSWVESVRIEPVVQFVLAVTMT